MDSRRGTGVTKEGGGAQWGNQKDRRLPKIFLLVDKPLQPTSSGPITVESGGPDPPIRESRDRSKYQKDRVLSKSDPRSKSILLLLRSSL